MSGAIGGYFGLECGRAAPYHGGVYLNSAKSALRLVIRSLGIARIHLPDYTCGVVFRAAELEGCEIVRYGLDARLLPDRGFPPDAFVLYTNYFGVCGANVEALSRKYANLVVDNAQAFFSRRTGRAAIYSPWKFFGVPDGGIAVGGGISGEGLPRDRSAGRMSHLLRRLDTCAEDGYGDYLRNKREFHGSDVMLASNLTLAIMGSADYEFARRRRLENFAYLHAELKSAFPFAQADDDVPLAYPYVREDAGALRERLAANRIYVPKYWPKAERCERLVETILPLPVDHRYGEREMRRIVEVIRG